MSLRHCMRHLRDGSEMHPWWLGLFSEYLFLTTHHLWKLLLPQFCILHHLFRMKSKLVEYSKTDGKSILLFICLIFILVSIPITVFPVSSISRFLHVLYFILSVTYFVNKQLRLFYCTKDVFSPLFTKHFCKAIPDVFNFTFNLTRIIDILGSFLLELTDINLNFSKSKIFSKNFTVL